MDTRHFLLKERGLWISLLVIAASLLVLGFNNSSLPEGCEHVSGKLLNSPGEGLPGRMIGGISGDYWIDPESFCFFGDNEPIYFMCSTSTVNDRLGNLYFKEYATIDFSENVGHNGAVLIVVQGGTDGWEGATGHIILSGYFHLNVFQGQWDYSGEVCTP